MECRTVLENASAYIDGELPAADAAGIAAHLRACGACAGEFRAIGEASAAVAARLPEIDLRPQVWNRGQERIAEIPAGRAGWFEFLFGSRLRVAAAASLIVVVLASGTWTAVRQRQARHEVEVYMERYIEQRRARAPETVKPTIHLPQGEGTENPFVDVDYSGVIGNPFVSEGK
jgi:anti-sigma factor RsiW